MSTKACHIYYYEFVYENNNILLSNDHIWKILSKFKQSSLPNQQTISYFQIWRIFILTDYCEVIEDWEQN